MFCRRNIAASVVLREFLVVIEILVWFRCFADEGAAVLATQRAEAMAREAAAVRNRLPVGHAAEDAARSRACIWRRAVPLQHDQRLIIPSN